ncbi:hypothetical protein E4U42_001742 [Claviceps africana]|uniref:Aprataxin C2HE/C2H2/C2HC zinc finger domain-containing protein n=1 Tax=Claviceps africana TaxID=83212 RepID=A0A8K0NF43_9HYPO|nr:hypothetical protein E4U42_001742 [Claviceps africana]
MAPKPKHHDHAAAASSRHRLGLGIYLSQPPTSFPGHTIIFHTPDFVAIHDKYPKSTVHALLLPRSPSHNLLPPLEALADDIFLRSVQRETARLRTLVASELQRRLGRYSRAEQRRQAVLDGAETEETGCLPAGRDWEAEVVTGVHAVPSMAHLHVHVLSRDMHADALRHRKHYNSFTTGFFVDVMALEAGSSPSPSPSPPPGGFLRSELRCWRCGRGFGNRFRSLKEHLDDEFVSWRSL